MNSQYLYYFLMLRRAFQAFENHVPIRTTMNDLVEILFCTQRNVKLVLNKLKDEKLIEFHSGKGRGNGSTIIFLENLEQSLQQQTHALLNKNEIMKALELVKEFGEGTKVESFIMEWVSTYFGYKQVNSKDNEELEILRFPIYRPLTTIDPVHVFFDLDAHIVMQVYNTLVEYDYKNRSFRKSLAHNWECSEDKKSWLFYLRKGVRFHNGRELTAEDVKHSILRLWHSPHKWLVSDIKEIKILSKYSILFQLQEPNTLFLYFVSFAPMSIIDIFDPSEGFAKLPIGTGPFKVESVDSNHCVLTAFKYYFGGRPHLDKVEIIRLPEDLREDMEERKRLIFDTGESPSTPMTQWDEKQSIFSGTNILTMNVAKSGPIQNLRLRRDILSHIDREKLTHLGKPRLGVASGFIITEEIDAPSPIVEKETKVSGKESVSSIGYSGERLTLVTYKRHAQDAYSIQQQLIEKGINVIVKIVEWDEIQSHQILNEADMILFEGTPNGNFISLFELFLFERGFIYPFLTVSMKETMNEKITKIKKEIHPSTRIKKYRELEKFLVEEGVLGFLVHKQVEVSYDTTLEGVSFNSRMWIDFKDLWYKQTEIDKFNADE
ncbi:SgrR family transcriptional regulator [Bacillus sp. SLBN-46]|uniref:ABC transporter substrate-binding protein n=1 Tax=Bacillus sp. SLBN-46 TaxID=3042283 RepID=UPI00285FF7CD|nr:ABC transporter substrate-binding protein [Bacillus sp. SLBN-46]MDR6123347.1 SgrR family transcriptional regulator [Bacillus sp. SLBN-46]